MRRRSDRKLLILAVLLGLPAAIVPACSCGDSNSASTSASFGGNGGASSSSGSSTSSAMGGQGNNGVGGSFLPDGGGCKTAADCDGGVCLSTGACCDSVEHACDAVCCIGAAVCLFDQCVTPGKACHTANDCAAGQYCETALGNDADGGTGGGFVDAGPDGAACTNPLPLQGRCVDRPPVCDPDGGTPDGGDAGCVADCEYHPLYEQQLQAEMKWQWGPVADAYRDFVDVWSTPTVGRVYDGNCDGKVDELDAPNVIFVSGNSTNQDGTGSNCNGSDRTPSPCLTGILRMLDGRTGKEIWSLDKASPSSIGFAGLSTAIGDIDGDGRIDIVAVTGEGYVVMIDANGNVKRTSDKPIPGINFADFGWGGGLAIADMDGDGFPEIAYGSAVFTTTGGAITLKFSGTSGVGGKNVSRSLSTFVDLDGDGKLELLAGMTAYKFDGTILWDRGVAGPLGPKLTDGFSAVGDFKKDGNVEAVLVSSGNLWILDGATGATLFGPTAVPEIIDPTCAGGGEGGPPTIADFDGTGKPSIGIASQCLYSVMKPNYTTMAIDTVWSTPNHDISSSVTGSSVFDFEGDGKAEVVYADECFLWVFDGQTGAVRFAAPHSSFTATEASLVADIDGDGHAEMLMVSNSADAIQWKCLEKVDAGVYQPTTVNGVTWTPGPYNPGDAAGDGSYRGLVLFGGKGNSWVGTRTLWSEHTYHVTNICDDRDTACDAPNVYGSVPKVEKKNWTLPWLDDFRQNVQDRGIFDAPDATVSLKVDCSSPVLAHPAVRNIGLASLPAGVQVGIYKHSGTGDVLVGTANTTHSLFPGQTEELLVSISPSKATSNDTFVAKIIIDVNNPTFHECRADNNESQFVKPSCVH